MGDSKDYFRLAPGKTVGLFGAPSLITCAAYKTDPVTGSVVEVENTGNAKKPKAFIQWVVEYAPSRSPIRVDEARIFHQLFKSDNPAASPDCLADINPDSLEVVKGALLKTGFLILAKKLWKDAVAESKARTEKASKEKEAGAHGANDGTPRATGDQLVGKECGVLHARQGLEARVLGGGQRCCSRARGRGLYCHQPNCEFEGGFWEDCIGSSSTSR